VIVPSRGGVFEVDVDGRRVFSKKEMGRHAEPGEALVAVTQALSRPPA
jgi:selenoprotein W-related protein